MLSRRRFLAAATTAALTLDNREMLKRVWGAEPRERMFHLTAEPWHALWIGPQSYLDVIEGVCRFTARHLDQSGAVIDPFLRTECQYATPYFAFAVGTLVDAGRALDLLPIGVQAMDHATTAFARGLPGIPQGHGEFFIAPLTGALDLYAKHVAPEQLAAWRERLKTPLKQVLQGLQNDWRTYAMKGEWLRAQAGLAERAATLTFITDSWLHATQRERIAGDQCNLYEDRGTDPESHAVEAVGRGNLLALLAAGYDGEFRAEMETLVERGTGFSLQLQGADGQCPPNGRTDDHVFNDVLYQLIFDVMAERLWARGERQLAGRYRRAAILSFNSIARWRRDDGAWKGSFFVTKNHLDPRDRVGYQDASQYSNYNGAVMLHLAEAYHARRTEIPEQPAPVEVGGYAFATDPRFASVVANAGGLQLFANLRGDTKTVYHNYWTPLGVVRIGRTGWDGWLGPSDGVRDAATGRGISFAPTWQEHGQWVRLADVPERYHGVFTVQSAHPLLVRCAIEYRPHQGRTGPTFRHEFTLTPDGIMARLACTHEIPFGVTWPLLEDDGRPLQTVVGPHHAATRYDAGGDEQNFLAVQPAAVISADEPSIVSPYGRLRPLRVTGQDKLVDTFIYPRRGDARHRDPDADAVRTSFRMTPQGFSSVLGRVENELYLGRTAAGGTGDRIQLTMGGPPDAVFDRVCRFVLQIAGTKIIAAEADAPLRLTIGGRSVTLAAYTPVVLA